MTVIQPGVPAAPRGRVLVVDDDAALSARLGLVLRGEGFEPLLDAVGARDALRGMKVTLEQGGRRVQGIGDGILPDGALRLRTPDGIVSIYSGEAHIGS